VDSNSLLISEAQCVEYLIKMKDDLIESRFDLMVFGLDTMLNYDYVCE
jgi:hypothetical protein